MARNYLTYMLLPALPPSLLYGICMRMLAAADTNSVSLDVLQLMRDELRLSRSEPELRWLV